MLKLLLRWLSVAGVLAGGVAIAATFAVGGPGHVVTDGDTPVLQGVCSPCRSPRTRSTGTSPTSRSRAGGWRATSRRSHGRRRASRRGRESRQEAAEGAHPVRARRRSAARGRRSARTRSSQALRSPGQRFGAMSGRIGALAIRPSNGQFILGAAQGGIWLYDGADGHVVAEDDRPDDAGDRRARDRAVERRDRLRRHRRGRPLGRLVLRQRRPQVDRRRQHLDARLGRRTSSGVAIEPDRRRPDERRTTSTPRSLRGRGGARRTSPDRALAVRHLGVEGRRRQLEADPEGAEGQPRRDRPRDRSAEPADPLLVVLGRRDLQEHRRRQELEPSHDRPARRRLRGRARRASRSRSRIRAGERRRALRRLRLGRRCDGPPPVARLQVDERRGELDDAARRLRRRHASRTTARSSASTTT